ncbi:hypothetical protein PAMP_007616 [Pampus punctatissimus]
MKGECKVLVPAAVDVEGRKQTMQTVKPSSKLTTALLIFTLCLAAAAATAAVLVLKQDNKEPGQDKDNFDLHHTLRQISNVRAAIHLGGEYNPARQTSVEWKSHVDQSHFQGGLELNNNEIVIPQNGLYFVYSQVSFRVSCSSNDITTEPAIHLSHTVERWSHSYGNNGSYHTILHSIRTVCQKTVSSDPAEDGKLFSAVYMGAVFNLNKDDRLRTVTGEKILPMLEDEPGKNFFGVFAL